MKNSNKISKIALGTLGVGAAAYFGIGFALCHNVLSRKAVNTSPDEILSDPQMMKKYFEDENFRNADDWFLRTKPTLASIKNSDGDLIYALEVKQKIESDKWLICSHGYNNTPRGMGVFAERFNQKGYNILLPFMRAHSKSEHKNCTMGYFDRYDVVCWINHIVNSNPDAEIVLMGVSMGAATTLLTTGENLPENVKCAVADCSYTSCWEEFYVQAKQMFHIPSNIVLYPANTVNKLFYKWDFKKCSPLQAVEKSKTPTLFIHGEKDDFVPFWMRDVLFDHCKAEKEKLNVPDAGHAQSVDINPELYWTAVDNFLSKYMS